MSITDLVLTTSIITSEFNLVQMLGILKLLNNFLIGDICTRYLCSLIDFITYVDFFLPKNYFLNICYN